MIAYSYCNGVSCVTQSKNCMISVIEDQKGKNIFLYSSKLVSCYEIRLFSLGTNRATLVDMNVLHAVGLVVFEDYVYWIDGMSRNVMKIKKGGETHGSVVQGGIDDLSDMIVVDTRRLTGRGRSRVDCYYQLANSLLLSSYIQGCVL